jgi:hypothetical protein
MSRRRKYQEEEDDDEVGGTQGFSLSQLAPEPSQTVPIERAAERSNLDKLDKTAREKYLTSLSRLILFKALEREPIDRLKVIKDAGIDSSHRIGSAAFKEASERLRNVFGFDLVRQPEYMSNPAWKAPKKYNDRFFVTNQVMDNGDGAHSRAIHSVHGPSSVERGFILLVNGLIFCKGESRGGGSRKILEKDLYRLLHTVDDSIPEEPPGQGTQRAKQQYRPGTQADSFTPNPDALLDQCVAWDYFIREKATEDNCSVSNLDDGDVLYSMGPRSAVEIGRRQIIYFCASILDEAPDPSMLKEVEEDMVEGEEMDETYMEAED